MTLYFAAQVTYCLSSNYSRPNAPKECRVEFVNEFHQEGIIVSRQFDDPEATFHLRETNL
jgi:hypothetical protein